MAGRKKISLAEDRRTPPRIGGRPCALRENPYSFAQDGVATASSNAILGLSVESANRSTQVAPASSARKRTFIVERSTRTKGGLCLSNHA